MSKDYQLFAVLVTAIESITPLVKCFTLQPRDGKPLPAFSAGSHIIVQMQDKTGQRFSNAYSLISDPLISEYYKIAVRLEESSKGGSAWMHQQVMIGTELSISTPNNLFPIHPQATKHLLIAGGIGITPFLAQLYELNRQSAQYELHYAFRSTAHAPFYDELNQLAAPIYRYNSEQGQRLDLNALLCDLSQDTHIYVCGPQSLIEDVFASTERFSIDKTRVHKEQFIAGKGSDGAFTLVLARSGCELQVESGISILQAIERSNAAEVECLCREGVCGTCETSILDGEAEHLDQYLTDEEKASGKTLMICVSRSRSERLVLDL